MPARISRAVMVAPATKSGGSIGASPRERQPGLVRQKGVEQRLAHRVVVDVGLAVKHHLGAGDVAVRLTPAITSKGISE